MQLSKPSLDIGLVVSDLDASLAFYRDTLGLTVANDMPVPGLGRMALVAVGGSMLKLILPEQPLTGGVVPGGTHGGVPGVRYVTFPVTDLDDVVAACNDGGHKVIIPPMEFGPGSRIAMVEDPDGNWVEFMETAAA